MVTTSRSLRGTRSFRVALTIILLLAAVPPAVIAKFYHAQPGHYGGRTVVHRYSYGEDRVGRATRREKRIQFKFGL